MRIAERGSTMFWSRAENCGDQQTRALHQQRSARRGVKDQRHITDAAKRFQRDRATVTAYQIFERRVEIRLSSLVMWLGC